MSSSSQVSVHSVEPQPSSSGELPADDALLKLFWNRAELKKEFARLRSERAALQDRIRHQEGQLLRAQQRLEQLEGLLADPAQAVRLALFYQLRSLWSYGRRRLTHLVREQTQRELGQAQREHQQAFAERRQLDLAEMDARLAAARERLREAKHELASARRHCTGLRALLRPGRCRTELAARQEDLDKAAAQLQREQSLRELRAAEQQPAEARLDTAGRRRVNLAAIALAQELLIHFGEEDLAQLAREAVARQFRDIDYGSSADCRRLSRLAAQRLKDLESLVALPAMVERRARYLAARAEYRRDADTVPVVGSVGSMPRRLSATLQPRDEEIPGPDVLADDYWDLYSVLLS